MRSDGPDGPRRWRRVISHLWSSLHTSITVKTVMDLDSSALPCPPPRLDTFAVEASHTAASTRAPTTFRITHRELQGSTMAQQRLNNGSFGAAPKPVLEAEMAHRSWWRANPDAAYWNRLVFAGHSASSSGRCCHWCTRGQRRTRRKRHGQRPSLRAGGLRRFARAGTSDAACCCSMSATRPSPTLCGTSAERPAAR